LNHSVLVEALGESTTSGQVSWQGLPMPWVRAKLKGASVLARVDENGGFVTQNGRVEVRYNPRDGRLYRASAANLLVDDPSVLPEETCAPAEAVDRNKKPDSKAVAVKAALDAQAQGGLEPAGNSIEAWTDGACSGNPGPAGLGIVLFLDGDRIEISEYLGNGTNNIAELTAILRALEKIDPERAALIRTDSQYSIGVLQKNWKAKANVELISRIKSELAKRKATRLLYTPGHAGVSLNERADQLARMAVATASSSEKRYPKPQIDVPAGVSQ